MNIYRLVFIVTLIVLTFSLKRSNIGKNDWNYKNIGQFREVLLSRQKIMFISEKGVYGSIDKSNGNLVFRSQLQNKEFFLNLNGISLLDQERILINSANNVIDSFKFDTHQKQNFLTTFESQTVSEPIKGILTLDDGRIVVITDHFFGYMHNRKYNSVSQQNMDKEYLGLFKSGDNIVVYFHHGIVPGYAIYRSSDMMVLQMGSFNIKYGKVDFTKNHLVFSNSDKQILTVARKNHTKQQSITATLVRVLRYSDSIIYRSAEGTFSLALATDSKIALPDGSQIFDNPKGKILKLETLETENEIKFRLSSELSQVAWTTDSKVLNLWFGDRNGADIDVLIQYEDLKTIYFTMEQTKKQIQPIWTKEESLAYVIDSVFLEYQNQKDLTNPYFDYLLSKGQQNQSSFLPMFIKRISAQIEDFGQGITQFFNDVKDTVSQIKLSNIFDPKKPVFRYQASNNYEKTYGLRKILMLVTSKNTVFALDTKTSNILWKDTLPDLNNTHLGLFRMISDEVQRVIITQHCRGKLTFIEVDRKTGEHTILKRIDSPVVPSITQISDQALQIRWKDVISHFTLSEKNGTHNLQTIKDVVYFRTEGNSIIGEKIEANKIQKVWNVQIPEGEQIIGIKSSFRGLQQAKLPLYNEKAVYYKNIDYTNFALITRSANTTLNLYIINGENGHIVFNKFKKNVDFTNFINLAYDQNSVIVTYFSRVNKIFEIWVVEQYQMTMQTSVSDIVSKYMDGKPTQTSRTRPNIIFVQQIFGSPLSIKHIEIATSKLALLKRNLVIITTDNQIYSIDRKILSARRPSEDVAIESDKLPKYEYLIPIIPQSFISYSLLLSDISQLRFNPTSLESTLFIFGYGIDLFMVRTTPQQMFDMITEDFNYLFLLVVVLMVTVGLVTIRRLTYSAKIKKHYRE